VKNTIYALDGSYISYILESLEKQGRKDSARNLKSRHLTGPVLASQKICISIYTVASISTHPRISAHLAPEEKLFILWSWPESSLLLLGVNHRTIIVKKTFKNGVGIDSVFNLFISYGSDNTKLPPHFPHS